MTKELLIKFLDDRCSEEELREVILWINKKATDKNSMSLGFDDWKSYQTEDDIIDDESLRSLFDKIQHKIDSKNLVQLNSDKKSGASSFVLWLTRAAAILLIPVLGILLYTLSEKEISVKKHTELFATDSIEVVAPIGSRTIVQLSDGSMVHLNYGSKIKYPQIFSGDTREVKLTGEGYFDVFHNPEKPFIVNARELNIKALGTSFNVQAYPDKEIIETTLVEGKVVLETNETNGENKTIGVMVPGLHTNYNTKTNKTYTTKGNIEKYIAWKDGKLIYEDAPITQVAEDLSRMFNVDIQIDEDIKDYIYTVTFVDEPLFQILDLMIIATPITYKALPRKKLEDGTFSKQKIMIQKRI